MTAPARAIVPATAALAAVAWWPALNDGYSLPKATVVVAGALAAVVATGAVAARRGTVAVRDGRVLAVLAGVALAVVVSTVLAEQPLQAVVGARQRYAGGAMYLACVALCALAVVTFDDRTVRGLARALVVVAGAIAAGALVQSAGDDAVRATMGNVDFVAGWLAVALPLCLWAAVTRSHGDGFAVAGGGVAVLVVITLVRIDAFQGPVAAGAGVAVVLGAWAVERGAHRRVRRGHVIAAGLVVAAGLAIAAPHLRAQLDAGLLERRLFWRAAVHDVADRPVLGHGLDSFGARWYRIRPAEHARRWPERNAGATHDVPLDMAVGGGVTLLVLYLTVVAWTARRLVHGLGTSSGEHRLLLAGVGGAWVAYQVQSLVSIDVPALAVAHWVLTGAVLACTAGAAHVRRVPRLVPAALTALAAAGLVVVSMPLRAEHQLATALAAERHGDERAAVAHLRRAGDLAPWAPVYRSYLTVRLADAEALPVAVRAAELAPGDPYAATSAADAAAAVGDVALERRWRAAAVRDDPRNPVWRRR